MEFLLILGTFGFWAEMKSKESLSVKGLEKSFFPPGEFLQKCVTFADLKGTFSVKVICCLLNPDKLGFLFSLFLQNKNRFYFILFYFFVSGEWIPKTPKLTT